MRRRADKCAGCPFRTDRQGPPVPPDVRKAMADRIKAGEQWICHATCDGPRVTGHSQLCAGAPAPPKPSQRP